MAQRKWTNADLPSVSRFGGPDLSTFEEEKPDQLDLSSFEPLENVDMKVRTHDQMGRKIAPVTVDPLKSTEPPKQEHGLSTIIPDTLSAAKDTAVGFGKQLLHTGQAMF